MISILILNYIVVDKATIWFSKELKKWEFEIENVTSSFYPHHEDEVLTLIKLFSKN